MFLSMRHRRKSDRHGPRREARDGGGSSATKVLVAALLIGGVAGVGSVAASDGGGEQVLSAANGLAVRMDIQRARPPQEGDFWGGCNSARAAGTAPIYRGEPGYRPEMDGDGDGVACEPYYER
jgi:hypothetical protein